MTSEVLIAISDLEHASNPPPAAPAMPIAHLENDLLLIQRYAEMHSAAPFQSQVPIIGPLIVLLKRAARGFLSGARGAALGAQDEFNVAVADILFEFTRRAAMPAPLTANEAALDQALQCLSASADGVESKEALALVAREVQLLREQVRAAQLSATESERLASELLRRVAALEGKEKQSA